MGDHVCGQRDTRTPSIIEHGNTSDHGVMCTLVKSVSICAPLESIAVHFAPAGRGVSGRGKLSRGR